MSILTNRAPRYHMTLPVTGEKIEFRPYLVKEEKNLILAKESEDIDNIVTSVKDIIRECTFGSIDVEIAPLFIMQYAFLQIRAKSVGEQFEFSTICGSCDHSLLSTINISDFKVIETPGHTTKITLGDGRFVTMRYPSMENFMWLFENDEKGQIQSTFDIIADCIVAVSDEVTHLTRADLTKQDLEQFVDELTPEQFEGFVKFITTMPVLRYATEFDCPSCNTTNQFTIDGINHFFG